MWKSAIPVLWAENYQGPFILGTQNKLLRDWYFQEHLFLCIPSCLLLELWQFPGAALEATSTSPKYSGNKEQVTGVHLRRSMYKQYIYDLSGVAGTEQDPALQGTSHLFKTRINFFLGYKYGTDSSKGDVLPCCGDLRCDAVAGAQRSSPSSHSQPPSWPDTHAAMNPTHHTDSKQGF